MTRCLAPLHRWKQSQLISVLENIVPALILHSDGHQCRTTHRAEIGKADDELNVSIADGCARRQFQETPSLPGQLAKIRIESHPDPQSGGPRNGIGSDGRRWLALGHDRREDQQGPGRCPVRNYSARIQTTASFALIARFVCRPVGDACSPGHPSSWVTGERTVGCDLAQTNAPSRSTGHQ